MIHKRIKTDYLIIGSGISGLSAALKAAENYKVRLITKNNIEECNTFYAQGGIASVLSETDSVDSHVKDTLKAGAGLCDENVVRQILEDGPKRIHELIERGCQFMKESDLDEDGPEHFDLGKEGGHSNRRIIHSGDKTGQEIIRALKKACLEHPNIVIEEYKQAVDLISSRRLGFDGPNICYGAWVLDTKSNFVHTYLSKFTVLATGGCGKVYLYTSNPDVASGEGIAMAYRAYAEIANMEFFQFHPTILYHPNIKSFLISEAVRGEGAKLKIKRDDEFIEFMADYHELGDLATRDIAARAIDRELKKTGQQCVYLDVTHHDEDFLKKRFPAIFKQCLKVGINMANNLIPVVPAAHYCCGGVKTDINGISSGIKNLYSIGEVACTGLHGANRLASNSLLEGLVVAANAIEHSLKSNDDLDLRHLDENSSRQIPDWNAGDAQDADELIVISHNWDEIRRFMWDYVGIFRTTKRLQRAKARIKNIRKEIEHFYWDFTITRDLIELRNLASVAEMIIDSALMRRESVGLHFNADCPEADGDSFEMETILRRPGFQKTLH